MHFKYVLVSTRCLRPMLVEKRLVIRFKSIRFEQFCDVVCRAKGGKFIFI